MREVHQGANIRVELCDDGTVLVHDYTDGRYDDFIWDEYRPPDFNKAKILATRKEKRHDPGVSLALSGSVDCDPPADSTSDTTSALFCPAETVLKS